MSRKPVTLADLPEHVRRQVRPQLDAQATAKIAAIRCIGGASIHRSGKRSWSAAKRTVMDGISFPSRVEARVWSALVTRYGRHRVVRPRTLNLWSSAPDAFGVPGQFRPDFAVFADGLPIRVAFYVDAKSGKRRSREWRRGVMAFRASYREPLYEWDGLGFPPISGKEKP